MFHFKTLSETEVKHIGLIPQGEYDFVVATAVQKQSKANLPMIELLLEIYDKQGNKRIMRDWLSASEAPMARMKIREFCYAIGMGDEYEMGVIDEFKLSGRSGKVEVFIEESRDPKYPNPRNQLKYIDPGFLQAVLKQAKTPPNSVANPPNLVDDDIPF